MGVQQPFFNANKRRDKKLAHKFEKLKKNAVADCDKKIKNDKMAKVQKPNGDKPEKKLVQNENKKDKAKGRTQKNSDQKLILQQEFQIDPTWSNAQCKRIAEQTGLSVAQVYKWGWDKKNRLAVQRYPQCDENLPPLMPHFAEGLEAPHESYQSAHYGAAPHL